jgi:hypothetical protein
VRAAQQLREHKINQLICKMARVPSLAMACHGAILNQHLYDDPHITVKEHLELLYTRFASKGMPEQVNAYHSLVIQQAETMFWQTSQKKWEIMSSAPYCSCGRCWKQLSRTTNKPWRKHCLRYYRTDGS